jgi:hypothetical protein
MSHIASLRGPRAEAVGSPRPLATLSRLGLRHAVRNALVGWGLPRVTIPRRVRLGGPPARHYLGDSMWRARRRAETHQPKTHG